MNARERQAWWLVTILFVEMFFVHGAYIILPLYMVPVEKALHWNRVRSSSLQTVWGLSLGAVGMPIVGWLMDFVDARIVMTAGILLLSAGFALAAQAHSYAELITAYFLIGVGDAGATLTPCAVVVSNWFRPERRGTAMGLALAGMSAGGMVLYIVVNRLIEAWGWRAGYGVIPIPIILLILPLVIWKVRSRPGAVGEIRTSSAPAASSGVDIGQALRTRSFWLVAIAQFTYQLTLGATTAHSIPYLTSAGFSRNVAVRAFGIATGLAGVGKIIMGWLADRITGRIALSIDLIGNAMGVAILLFISYRFMLASWTIVWGLTIIAPLSLIPLVLIDCFGLKRLGSLIGLLYLFAALGGMMGPISLGWLYVHRHSYRLGFEILVSLLIFSGICALGCTAPRELAVPQPEAARVAR
jgi:MFS family permease